MPGRSGADPSLLVAIVAPLLFGYMFGDVGQGIVLLIAGLALSRRLPALRLLVPGGVAAIAFGAVFGSVFSVEGILPALWIQPLGAPVAILRVPLVACVPLLALGLLIGAMEAWWARESVRWLLAESGLLVVYLGIALAFVDPGALVLALIGIGWQFFGNAWLERAPLKRCLQAGLLAVLGLAENTIQILINTLSFVRVGAFALAHAGLSAAAVALARGTGSAVGYAIVLVAGNALIIVLEGLVVSIQTTRLVLFEFFIRFFIAKGRVFRPLAPPSISIGRESA
jgi:V/A-type H+-transporting ATPase subunit I